MPDAQHFAAAPSNTIWVRNGKAPKAISALAVSVTPGDADPQAVWSPDGNAVAYLAHGDLFVADLTEREVRPLEKLAAGEPLTCDEEREVPMSNLKQIGMGLKQYVSDNHGKFPTGGLPRRS